MKNFDRSKYPLDHNFVEHIASNANNDYIARFNIYYNIECINCGLFISHEECLYSKVNDWFNCLILDSNNSESIKLFCYESRDYFDFSKVYSCADVQIKKLLE